MCMQASWTCNVYARSVRLPDWGVSHCSSRKPPQGKTGHRAAVSVSALQRLHVRLCKGGAQARQAPRAGSGQDAGRQEGDAPAGASHQAHDADRRGCRQDCAADARAHRCVACCWGLLPHPGHPAREACCCEAGAPAEQAAPWSSSCRSCAAGRPPWPPPRRPGRSRPRTCAPPRATRCLHRRPAAARLDRAALGWAPGSAQTPPLPRPAARRTWARTPTWTSCAMPWRARPTWRPAAPTARPRPSPSAPGAPRTAASVSRGGPTPGACRLR